MPNQIDRLSSQSGQGQTTCHSCQRLSVVIPAFNEEQRLPKAVAAVTAYLTKQTYASEIIVVDDGSTDGTANVVQELIRTHRDLKLLRLDENQGKGAAVKTGIFASAGDFVLFADADQSTPIHQTDKLMPFLTDEGYDIAVGSRGKKGAEVGRSQVWYRRLAGKLFGCLGRALLYRGIVDSQCGFKLMTREAAQSIFRRLSSPTAIFDMELLVLAGKFGFSVAEVPVEWNHDPDTRIAYNMRKSVRIVWELLRIKFRHRVWWSVRVRTWPRSKHQTAERQQ